LVLVLRVPGGVPHTNPFQSPTPNTHTGGKNNEIGPLARPREICFFPQPPLHTQLQEMSTAPPMPLIKVLPSLTSSTGLVVVSVKMMVRPHKFEREGPPKSQKDECRNGTIFFTRT
jgi:hypothetical protein